MGFSNPLEAVGKQITFSLGIAALVMSYQVMRTATANPLKH